jgi:hypothetical protein
LSKNLEKKYAGRQARDPAAVVPFYHIRAVLANEVANWVNTNTNFGRAAAAILNWGAFIQVKTHAKQSGNEIVMDQFEVIYPSEAVTNVELSAGKTFYSTGSKGNFTFVILYNGATELRDDPDDSEAEEVADYVPPESGVTARAGGVDKDEKLGTDQALGRKRQK